MNVVVVGDFDNSMPTFGVRPSIIRGLQAANRGGRGTSSRDTGWEVVGVSDILPIFE